MSQGTICAKKYECFLQFVDSNFFGLESVDVNFGRDVVLNVVQSMIIKSPIQPPPEFSAYPINVPGSIFVPNWSLSWKKDFQRFQPQNGFTGPSNGVPNLVSYCDFLSASLSCMFRKEQKA